MIHDEELNATISTPTRQRTVPTQCARSAVSRKRAMLVLERGPSQVEDDVVEVVDEPHETMGFGSWDQLGARRKAQPQREDLMDHGVSNLDWEVGEVVARAYRCPDGIDAALHIAEVRHKVLLPL
jgi:hypothetical protein